MGVEPIAAADLLDLPDDGHRRELGGGVLTTTAPAGARYGSTAARLLLRAGVACVWVVGPQSRVVTGHDGAGARVVRADADLDG